MVPAFKSSPPLCRVASKAGFFRAIKMRLLEGGYLLALLTPDAA
jgi:hypothetical protein